MNEPDQTIAMTRAEAVERVVSVWRAADSQFLGRAEEYASSEQELRSTLRALGVTDAEISAELGNAPTDVRRS